jgi:hypothetical protein
MEHIGRVIYRKAPGIREAFFLILKLGQAISGSKENNNGEKGDQL